MTGVDWRLSVRGDARRAGTPPARTGFRDLLDAVDAAELAGVDGILVPRDPAGDESWVVAGAALRATRHLRVTAEFDPTFGSPVYAAKVSATLQRLSRGRFGWRLQAEPDADEARTRGDVLASAERYRRAAEFLEVARGVWNSDPVVGNGFEGTGFEYDGDYFHVAGGGFRGILSGLPFPRVEIAGDGGAALALSARLGDVHVFTERRDAPLEDRLIALRSAAAATGRTVGVALELPVIARETDDEAWQRADRLVRQAGGEPGAADRLDAVRWAGFRAAGFGEEVGLVGSYSTVAHRLREYAEAGVDRVILTGRPHIEEIHRVGEHLLHLTDPSARLLRAPRPEEANA